MASPLVFKVGLVPLAAGVRSDGQLRIHLVLQPQPGIDDDLEVWRAEWITRISKIPAEIDVILRANAQAPAPPPGPPMGRRVASDPLYPVLWQQLLKNVKVVEQEIYREPIIAPSSYAAWFEELQKLVPAPERGAEGPSPDAASVMTLFPASSYLISDKPASLGREGETVAASNQRVDFFAERVEGLGTPGEDGEETDSDSNTHAFSSRLALAQRNKILMQRLGLLWELRTPLPRGLPAGEVVLECRLEIPGLVFEATRTHAFLERETHATYFEIYPRTTGFFASGFLDISSFVARQADVNNLTRMAARANRLNPASSVPAMDRIQTAVVHSTSGGICLFRTGASRPPGMPAFFSDQSLAEKPLGKVDAFEVDALVQGYVVDVSDQADDSDWRPLCSVNCVIGEDAKKGAVLAPITRGGTVDLGVPTIGAGESKKINPPSLEAPRSLTALTSVLDHTGFITAYWQHMDETGKLRHVIVLRTPAGERLFDFDSIKTRYQETQLLPALLRPGNWVRIIATAEDPANPTSRALRLRYLEDGVTGFFEATRDPAMAYCHLALPWVGGVQQFRRVPVRFSTGVSLGKYGNARGSWILSGTVRRPRPRRAVLVGPLDFPLAPGSELPKFRTDDFELQLPLAADAFINEPFSNAPRVVLADKSEVNLTYSPAGEILSITPVEHRLAAEVTVVAGSASGELHLAADLHGVPIVIECGSRTSVWAAGAGQYFVTMADLEAWIGGNSAPIQVEGVWLSRTRLRAERVFPFPADTVGRFDAVRTADVAGVSRLQYRFVSQGVELRWINYDEQGQILMPGAPGAGWPLGIMVAIETDRGNPATLRRMSRRPLALGGTLHKVTRDNSTSTLEIEVDDERIETVTLPWPLKVPPVGSRVVACYLEPITNGVRIVQQLEVEFPVLFRGEIGDVHTLVYDATGQPREIALETEDVRKELLEAAAKGPCLSLFNCRMVFAAGQAHVVKVFRDDQASAYGTISLDQKRELTRDKKTAGFFKFFKALGLVGPELGPNRESIRLEFDASPTVPEVGQPAEIVDPSLTFEADEFIPWSKAESLPFVGQATAIAEIPQASFGDTGAYFAISLRRAIDHGLAIPGLLLETMVAIARGSPGEFSVGRFYVFDPGDDRRTNGFVPGRISNAFRPGIRPVSPSRQAIMSDALFGWDGWNLCAPYPLTPKPTPSTGAPAVPVTNGETNEMPLDCTYKSSGDEKSLRFGRKYFFRLRAFDASGRTIPSDTPTPPELRNKFVRSAAFYRREPVAPPRLFVWDPKANPATPAGENPDSRRFVVSKTLADFHDERQIVLVPPAVQFDLLDRCGLFDPVSGVRDSEMLAGVFKLVSTRDIQAQADERAKGKSAPPAPDWRHFTAASNPSDRALFKFLPDPHAAIFELCVIPDPDFHPDLRPLTPVQVELYQWKSEPKWDPNPGDSDWPNGWFPTLHVKAVDKSKGLSCRSTFGRDGFIVDLPEGMECIAKLRCIPHERDVTKIFGVVSEKMIPIPVPTGGLFPETTLRLVHAVPEPATFPAIRTLVVSSRPKRDWTNVTLAVRAEFDLPTTGRSQIEASRIEYADRPGDPLPTIPLAEFGRYVIPYEPLEIANNKIAAEWGPWIDHLEGKKVKLPSNAVPLPAAFVDFIRNRMAAENAFVAISDPQANGAGEGSSSRLLGGTIKEVQAGEYREYCVRVAAKSRFEQDFPKSASGFVFEPLPFEKLPRFTVKATRQPATPDVAYLLPLFAWTRTRDSAKPDTDGTIEMNCAVRIYLRRGWFSSGHGEQLAVAFALSDVRDDPVPSTAWAKDPIYATAESDLTPITAENFFQANREVFSSTDRQRVMVAGRETELLCFTPKFNPARGFWYVDIKLPKRTVYGVMLRLALCRVQKNSEPGFLHSDVVQVDPLPIPADRRIKFGLDSKSDAYTVKVEGVVPAIPSARGQLVLEATLEEPIPIAQLPIGTPEGTPEDPPEDESWWQPANAVMRINKKEIGQPCTFPADRTLSFSIRQKSSGGPFRYALKVQEIDQFGQPPPSQAKLPRVVFSTRVPLWHAPF